MDNIIRRTFNGTVANAYVFDKNTKTISIEKFTLDTVVSDNEKALKILKRTYTENIVDIESLKSVSALFGMTEKTFIENATVFAERNKENRGMVSKTISVPVASVLVMNADKTVKTVELVGVRTEKEARKALDGNTMKFIMVDSVKEDEKLYCMGTTKFISLAKPMLDNFHFVPEK